MSEDRDDRIVEYLRQAAPAARDPLFRIHVLARREQRQFQRRLYTMLAGLLVILLVSGFAVASGGGSLRTTAAAVAAVALASAYLAFRGRVLRILRRFSI